MMKRVRIALIAAMNLGFAVTAGHAAPGSVLIWPIDPVIEPSQRAAALWLENTGKTPIMLQVRVFAWKQQSETDVYAKQSDVIGTPPMVRIDPGRRQLVRLTRTVAAAPNSETAYRVVIDEIPTPEAAPAADQGAKILFRMRYSIPLFSYGAGIGGKEREAASATPRLEWRPVTVGDKGYLQIRNQGPVHARLVGAAFGGDQATPFAPGLLGYVLPGATMRWPLPQGVRPDRLTIVVNGTPRRTIASASE